MLPGPSSSRYISAPDVLANFDRADGTRQKGVIADADSDLFGTAANGADVVVAKRTSGAFANTDLEPQLKARGVAQVVIAGVVTGTGVESTVRQACEGGFNVTLALDAMTDVGPEAHSYSVGNVFPRLGETGMSREIINRLATRSA